jgi:tetratricopeptide (TPR) repeat protein
MLRAFGGQDGAGDLMDEWTLSWLDQVADPLVSQAPRIAAELLTRAVANSPPVSPRGDWFASRLADAVFRTGDAEQAEQVAIRTLEHATEPDVLVDLHRTLAQCRILAGRAEDCLATLDQALAFPNLSARHRARLLVLAARVHHILGEAEEAGRVADRALAPASEADDNWAIAWALHVLTLVAMMEGHSRDALPLFDRALTATQADPALIDLRLLLQINKAVTLGNLDRYEEALATARQAQLLADQVGTAIRLAQAHGALAQLLFYTGRWDDALTEVAVVPENVKEPAAACNELGIASVISFHRGEIDAGRRFLSGAAPSSKGIGHRLIGPLALARSREHEYDGAIAEALGVLTDAFTNSEDLDELEILLPDAVRLAVVAGDLGTAQALTRQAT